MLLLSNKLSFVSDIEFSGWVNLVLNLQIYTLSAQQVSKKDESK